MDERKKKIGSLEQQKRENRAALDVLLARLGEALLGRPDDTSTAEMEEYRRLHHDIAGFQAAIQEVEEQLRRLREIDEGIAAAEQDEASCSKGLSVLHAKLGRMLLDESAESGAYADYTAPWREQADALLGKIGSLDERVAVLEDKEGGNVFTWIGKNAQGLVLRSFLTRAQDNLEQICRNMGERYSRRDTYGADTVALPVSGLSSDNAEIEALCVEIEGSRAEAHNLAEVLAGLKEEKHGISKDFSAEGDPLKQIQGLKKQSALARDELSVLYHNTGAQAAGISAVDSPKHKKWIASLIMSEDRETVNTAARLNQAILDDEAAINRLRASLAIDEEKVKIVKYGRMIEDKRARIADAEKDIAEFNSRIKGAEDQIEALQKLL